LPGLIAPGYRVGLRVGVGVRVRVGVGVGVGVSNLRDDGGRLELVEIARLDRTWL
jgi:hypothetical protein